MRTSDRIVLVVSWLVPVAGAFGGALLMRGQPGDLFPGLICVAASLLMHAEVLSMLKTLLKFHADEYRRLTGKEP